MLLSDKLLGDEIIADVRNLLQHIEQAKENVADGNEEFGSVAIQQGETSEKNEVNKTA